MENLLNYQIQNNNGILYTIVCQQDEKAILLGGNDYVVIEDLSNFRKLHSWGGGKYFPHFKEDSIGALQDALNYFRCICGCGENEEDKD